MNLGTHLLQLIKEQEAGSMRAGLTPGPDVVLVVQRDRPPAGERIRLAARVGPLGEILNVQGPDDGGRYKVVARFRKDQVRAFAEKLDDL